MVNLPHNSYQVILVRHIQHASLVIYGTDFMYGFSLFLPKTP